MSKKSKNEIGKTSRRKGHDAERYYTKFFKDIGFEYCNTSRMGSRLHDSAGIDLINLPFNIQIKAGIQKSLNPGKELFNMYNMTKVLFPSDDNVHQKPFLLIHKKNVGKGNKETIWHQIIYMSYNQFEKFKIENNSLKYIDKKDINLSMHSEFKSIVSMTFSYFTENIIKKNYGINNNKEQGD